MSGRAPHRKCSSSLTGDAKKRAMEDARRQANATHEMENVFGIDHVTKELIEMSSRRHGALQKVGHR